MRKTVWILGILAGLTLAGRLWADTPAKTPASTSSRDLCKDSFEGYKDRLRKNPDDAAAWSELRVCADLLKRWGEAGAIAQAAIDKNVKRAEPHLILGMAYYRSQDYPHAVDEYQEAIRLKDDQALPYFQLGLTYLHMNQPEDAVAAGVRATELDPNNAAYHHQLAFAYFMQKEDDKSLAEAKRSVELDTNDVAAYKIMSNVYARQGRQDLADKMMEESIHANGRIAKAHPFVPDKQLTEADMPKPFAVETPPSDTEVFLKADWEKMKQAAAAGDIERTVSFYTTENGVQETYRQSLQRMGTARMQQVFSKLAEISDCDISFSGESAVCRCSVNGAAGTMLQTNVHFNQDPDHIWRIKSF